MAKVSYEVRTDRPRKDGSFAIRILVTHQSEKKHISTPWSVAPQHFKRGRITDHRVDGLLQDYLRQLRADIDDLGVRVNSMSLSDLIEYLQAAAERGKTFSLDFVAYTRAYIEHLQAKNIQTNINYVSAINSLCRFLNTDKVDINALTTRQLQRWVSWLQDTTKGSAPSLYCSVLRAMYNRAMREFNDEDIDVIRIPRNPFKKVNIPKPPLPRKRALSPSDLVKVFSVELPTSVLRLVRDMFKLSFYLCGMNLADLYEVPLSAYADGRLTYKRRKTRTRRADEAEISIKVEPEAAEIINRYKDPQGEFLLNLYRKYSTIGTLHSTMSTIMPKLRDLLGFSALTFYAARHSWATIAVNDLGIDKYTVHEALNHSDPSMKITDFYIRKNYANVDKANRAVIDFINNLQQ